MLCGLPHDALPSRVTEDHMPKIARRGLVAALGMTFALSVALPASAGQIISYRGETDQAERVHIEVVKRDSGRRFFSEMMIFFTVTCADGSTGSVSGIGFGRIPGYRLGENGEFQIDDGFSRYVFHVTGTVGFRSAQGTFELKYANLNEAEEPQLCTTGVVDWSADRTGSRPIRSSGLPLDDGVTLFETNQQGELLEVNRP